ncbi:MAG: hypothetical protein CUN56_08730 [Phototrophicales bacterium]|nr:MAG: hypothetical protein CUN56_08730 [Phototrophicales bacterium]RMG74099.1 MAG: GAF domain-containing protein [Chloroflexota bacterium]
MISIQEHLNQLTTQIDNLMQLLTSQRDLLEARGMSLPSGSLDNLRLLKRRIATLSTQISQSFAELQKLRALADTTAVVNSALETEDVLNQVMQTIVNITGAERGYLVLKNEETGEFDDFRVVHGIDQNLLLPQGDEPNGKRNELIISKTIVNEVVRTKQAVVTDNASLDTRYQGHQSIVGFALRSVLAVPLKVRDEVIGVVYCDNRVVTGLFQQSDLEIMNAFSNQAGVAIENARLFERIRYQIQQLTDMRELMRNVFDSIANGVITVNAAGIITTCNAAAHNILHQPEVVGRSLDEITPLKDDKFNTAVDLVMADSKQRTLEIKPVLPQIGQRVWNIIISPLLDADHGEKQGVAIVLADLTEKKAREAQLAELRRYLPAALIDSIRSIDDVNVAGQERYITAIATDVRGFTSFSEHLRPEQLMEIINKYLSLASDGIQLYEGIVDKYMGDAVTGLFNTQLNPQQDHAIRAVRAAMSIIYDLLALHEIMPEDQRLYYGIGIHTGTAYLGNIGSADRQEFSALGEATNVSKFLESQAQAGEIIISEATYEHVKEFFECEARQVDGALNGYDHIQTVYRVVKRKKGVNTGQLFLDPELAELLADLNRQDEQS